MTKRIFRQIHLWLSVPFGLIITLICFSGAILIFERDFGHIGQAHVDSEGRVPLPIDSILLSTDRYLSGKNQIVGITTYPDADHAYKVMLSKPAMAALWVNQYTGEVIGDYERAKIFKWASAAHRRFFGKSKAEGAYGAKTGKLIIGISSIALLIIILSGIVIWFPRNGKWEGKFSISTRQGAYRFWFDFHCVGGILCSIVLVLCVLTGLNWSFGWYRTAFYGAFGNEVAKSSSHKTIAENFPAWETAYKDIKEANPDKEIRLYQEEIDVVKGGAGNQQAVDTYKINPVNGATEALKSYNDKDKSNHIKGWIYTLHVGSWLGWATKILYLLSVIVGMLLPITGYYLWIKRLILKSKKRHS